METRQRRPEELGLLQALGAGSGLESPRAAPTPPGPELSRETAWSIGIQVTLPFLFAGLGLSGAGILLHYFQANTGQIDDPREQYRVVSSNLALVQVQAAVVGLLAAVAALLLGLASGQGLDVVEAQVLCASSVLTASLAACALGTLMVCIVVGARKLGVNPDNIATPIAASLGDLITLSLLAVVSSFFYRHREPPRCEDPQVRLVPHRPGDARQQPRGPYLEQDPVPAAVQRHGRLCSHHVWRWWQPGGHSDQPDLHVPAPVEHARGPAPLDEKMLARPVLHVLQLRNQRHVGPRPAAARGAWPLGLLLRRLPARKPVGPERQDLRAPVPAGGSGPGDGPAAPGGRGGPAGVAAGPGPGRPLHPVPHGAGRPAGHWPAGALLPRPPAAGDWGAAGRPPGPGAWTLLGARETPPSHPRDPTQLLWPDPRAGQPLPSTHGARGDGALSPQGRPPPSSGDRPAPPFCSQCL
ncbi:solute carrier family 41 member 3 isoform X4 [Cervus canadensis]|uniref:solute carrier family 41 member 3 isoform X4 n=1 Tax=Cervus canadensis TaxID=1574408 RepID=UPI001CA305C3|nr:solute carrier family 41 member 3 isoform X4 [Cervus canadensis]